MKKTLSGVLFAVITLILNGTGAKAQSLLDTFGIEKSVATSYIAYYHGLFNVKDQNGRHGTEHKDATIDVLNRNRTSFIVPSRVLNYLMTYKQCDYIVFSLAYTTESNNQKLLSLIYTGLQSTSTPGKYNEISIDTIIDGNRVSYMLDNTFPCPTCDGVGIHEISGLMSTAMLVTHMDCPSCPPAANYGSITPQGQTSVRFGKDTTISWTVKPGYQINSIMVNGVDSTATWTSPHLLQHITASNDVIIQVAPKQQSQGRMKK
jgi:hypothetical protein